MTTHATTLSGQSSLGLLALTRRWMQAHQERAAERNSLAALSKLDERLLRDVGLSRADVTRMTDGL